VDVDVEKGAVGVTGRLAPPRGDGARESRDRTAARAWEAFEELKRELAWLCAGGRSCAANVAAGPGGIRGVG